MITLMRAERDYTACISLLPNSKFELSAVNDTGCKDLGDPELFQRESAAGKEGTCPWLLTVTCFCLSPVANTSDSD